MRVIVRDDMMDRELGTSVLEEKFLRRDTTDILRTTPAIYVLQDGMTLFIGLDLIGGPARGMARKKEC